MTRKKFLRGILEWLAKVPSKGDKATVDFGNTEPMNYHGWGTRGHKPNLRVRGQYHAHKGEYAVEIVEANRTKNVVIEETTVPTQGGLPPTKEQTLEALIKKIKSLINKGGDSDDEDGGNKGARSGSSGNGGANSTMALVRAECHGPSLCRRSPWKRFKSLFRRLSFPDLGARVLDTVRPWAPFVIGGVVVIVIVAAGIYAGPTIYGLLSLGQLNVTAKVAKTVVDVLVATPNAKTVAGVLAATPTVVAALPRARAALRHVVKSSGVSVCM